MTKAKKPVKREREYDGSVRATTDGHERVLYFTAYLRHHGIIVNREAYNTKAEAEERLAKWKKQSRR